MEANKTLTSKWSQLDECKKTTERLFEQLRTRPKAKMTATVLVLGGERVATLSHLMERVEKRVQEPSSATRDGLRVTGARTNGKI